MIKKKKTQFKDIFTFGFLSMASNLLATVAIAFFAKYILKQLGLSAFTNILMWCFGILICMGIPLGVLFFYMKKRVAFLYQPSENRLQWLKSAMQLIIPGEALRYLLCLSKLGLLDGIGLLGFLPTFLYEQTYLSWSGRMVDVRHFGNKIFGDYLAFTLCYFIYIVGYLIIAFAIYRYFWKQESKGYNEMLRHPTNKHFQ